MIQKNENRHVIDTIFVLALFAIFAVCALMLVSIGAGVYQKTVDDMNSNYNSRTTYSYIAEKLRQSDISGSVSIGQLDDLSALVLSEEIEGNIYSTYLYAYDGYLRELFVSPDFIISDQAKNAGQKLLQIKDFSIQQISSGLYKFSMTTNDNQKLELFVSPKSERTNN